MTEQRGEDEQVPMQRELSCSLTSAPPELAHEGMISRRIAEVLDSSGEITACLNLNTAVASPAAPLFTEVTRTLLQEPTEPPTTLNVAQEQVSAPSYCGPVTASQSLPDESQPKTLHYDEHQQALPSVTKATLSTLLPQPTEPPTRRELTQELFPAPSGHEFIKSLQTSAPTTQPKTSASPAVPSFMEHTLSTLQPQFIEPHTSPRPAQHQALELPYKRFVTGELSRGKALPKTLNGTVSQLACPAEPSLTTATPGVYEAKPIEPPSIRQLATEQVPKSSGRPFVEVSESCLKAMISRLYWKEAVKESAAAPLFMKDKLSTVPPEFTEAIEKPGWEYGTSKQSNHLNDQLKTLPHIKLPPMSPAAPLFTTAKLSTLQHKNVWPPAVRQAIQKQIRLPPNSAFEMSSRLRGVKLQQASGAAPSITTETRTALQHEPAQPATAQEVVVAPGWGFVACLQSHHLKDKPKLHQSEQQQECHCRLTSYNEFSKAFYDFITIKTGKVELFFVPSRISSECNDGTIWSRARQALNLQCRERCASRLPTQPKREFCGGRRALYPDQPCRRLQATSCGSLKTGSRDSRQEGQRLTGNASMLHNERLSASELHQKQSTPSETFEWAAEPLVDLTKDSLQNGPAEGRRLFLATSLGATSVSRQMVDKTQKTKTFRDSSSLKLTENASQKCAIRSPSVLPANIRMLRLEKVFDYIRSQRSSTRLRLSKGSVVTDVGRCPMSTENTARFLEDANVLVENNDLCWDEAQSEINAVNSSSELTNQKQLSPSSSQQKDERRPSLDPISFIKDDMQSKGTDSSSICAAPSVKDASLMDSTALYDIAPSVAETLWVNRAAPLNRDSEQNQEPRAKQKPPEVNESKNEEKFPKQTTTAYLNTSPQTEVASSLEKMKSINEVEATKIEGVRKRTASETERTSNYALTCGSKEMESASKPKSSLRKCSKNKMAPSEQECGENQESVADETKYDRNSVSENGNCLRKTSSLIQHPSAQEEETSIIQQIEPLNEAATGKEPAPNEKSFRTDTSQSIATDVCADSRNVYKPNSTPDNFVTDRSTQVAMASPRKSCPKKMPSESQATPSKPKFVRNAGSLPEKLLPVGEQLRESEETIPKTVNSSGNPLARGSEKVEITSNTQPVPSQDRRPDLGIDAEAPAPTSHSPTTKAGRKRSLSVGKSTLRTVYKERPSKLCKFGATAEGLSQFKFHARLSAVDDKGDSLETSQPVGVPIMEFDSAHDAHEGTSFERLSSVLHETEQRQKGTGVPAKSSSVEYASDSIHKKGDSQNGQKEQAHSATEMTSLAQRLPLPNRSWTDVVAGVRKTKPKITPADTAACAQSLPMGDSKERDSSKGSPCAQLEQDGLAQEYLTLGTQCPPNQTKQGDDGDAKSFEPIKIGSREWIELLRKKVKEPEHREEKLLSRSRFKESTTSQEKQLNAEIIVMTFRPTSLELPHRNKTYSEVCKNTEIRKQGLEKVDFCEDSLIPMAGTKAVIPKGSVPTKNLGNEQDACGFMSQNEGSRYFQDDMSEDNYDQNEPSKWEWNTGRKTLTPREVPTLFPSSHSGSACCEPNDIDASGYQVSAYTVQRDVEQWQLHPPCSRSQKPYSERHTSSRCSNPKQACFSHSSTYSVFTDESAHLEAVKYQSPFSYSDWHSFDRMTDLE